jgi:acyl dehydratase
MDALYFEDFTVGRRFESPGLALTEAEILDFARRYDPQPFHLDAVAARQSPYGGLIASGLHTLTLTFKLFLETGALAASSLGSPGLDEIRWRLPVRPGDTLQVVVEVVAARPSASKPDRGIATLRYEMRNQHGEVVLTMRGHQILRRRPTASAPG